MSASNDNKLNLNTKIYDMNTIGKNKIAKSKIAIEIRDFFTLTGAVRIVISNIIFLLKNEYVVHVYTVKVSNLVLELIKEGTLDYYSNFKITKISYIPFFSGNFKRYIYSFLINIFFKINKYDLIIGHGNSLNQDIFFVHNNVAMAAERIPHSKPNKIISFQRKILLNNSFKVLVSNSNMVKEDISSRYEIPMSKIYNLYPGYNDKVFYYDKSVRESVRARFGFKKTDFILGFITSGNLEKRGIDIFIEILKYFNDDPKIKGLIVGNPKEMKKFSIFENDLRDKVTISPLRHDIYKCYNAIDLLVHSAYFEEFGLVVLESLACGTPVVTSEYVGASEVINDTELRDLLVTKGVKASLFISNIERILKFKEIDKENIDNMRAKCANLAKGYTSEYHNKKLLKIIKENSKPV